MLILKRDTATYLFAVLWQADRSVTTGLHGRWPEVRDYYQEKRAARLRRLLERFGGDPEGPVQETVALMRGRLAPRSSIRHEAAWSVRTLAGKHKRRYLLSDGEQCLIAFTVSNMLRLLDAERPDQDEILRLREDLGFCVSIILRHMGRVPEKARRVENLGQPPWEQHYSIEEITPEPE